MAENGVQRLTDYLGETAEPISLGDLAYVCRLYQTMTDYGRSLGVFRDSVGGSLDLTNPKHGRALFDWLNAWTCRIDSSYREPLGEELHQWFGCRGHMLPAAGDRLQDLSDAALEGFICPFDELSALRPEVARRSLGPTAASKTMFALHPAVFVAWDAPMRGRLVGGESGGFYVEFLKRMRNDLLLLEQQCSKIGFMLEAVPDKIGRPDATPAQLIGEYYWVTVTRKAQAPDAETLRRWAAWS